MTLRQWLTFVLCLAGTAPAFRAQIAAAQPPGKPDWLLPLPGLDLDPAIPTLRQVTGHDWARDITTPAQVEQYLQALQRAAPERTRLVRYGASYENRPLYYLVITAPRHASRLDALRRQHVEFADPRLTTADRARELAHDDSFPALVWLAYSVHGNETSSSDAALLTAYHLLADRREETRRWLDRLVVVIDPLQNPDGRQRFIQAYQEARGAAPDAYPWSREHTERWPGGRFNHYLFDLNRDWFLQSQQESRAKIAAYLSWQPQIYVDAHEMGADSTYYFVPPADPINPFLLPKQRQWLQRIGKHQSEHFDHYGFRYTTREIFDAFYPGYGSEWPTLQGGLGILWEQAGVRGLVIDRNDETRLAYHDGVRHHYVSGLATIEFAARERELLLEDFYDARSRGVELGNEGAVRHAFLLAGDQPQRAARLARLLMANGVDVQTVRQEFTIGARKGSGSMATTRTVPPGTYHVPIEQPTGRLIRSLLDPSVEMDQPFVQRQLQRNELYLPDEIYDVTAWSLPLAFDVPVWMSTEMADIPADRWDGHATQVEPPAQDARLAYLIRGTDEALTALCSWLRAGLRIHVSDQPLRIGERTWDRGTLMAFVHDNPPRLHQAVRDATRRWNLDVAAVDSGFVTEGAHFGGPNVHWIRPPRVLLVMDEPASPSAGHTWYLFDQILHYPVTCVNARDWNHVEWDRFNVLVMPDGSYDDDSKFDAPRAERLRDWVRQGGTLVLVKGAAAWAVSDPIHLLDSQLIHKPETMPEDPTRATKLPEKDANEATKPVAEPEPPSSSPGAFFRAQVYVDHWLAFGCHPELDAFYAGNVLLEPLQPGKGRNVVTFAKKDGLLTSGFCWPQTIDLMAETPYLVYQPLGEGHIVAFIDDPNFRAMYPSLQRFFINAVLFGPGHRSRGE